jgi:hypothetical protein
MGPHWLAQYTHAKYIMGWSMVYGSELLLCGLWETNVPLISAIIEGGRLEMQHNLLPQIDLPNHHLAVSDCPQSVSDLI